MADPIDHTEEIFQLSARTEALRREVRELEAETKRLHEKREKLEREVQKLKTEKETLCAEPRGRLEQEGSVSLAKRGDK